MGILRSLLSEKAYTHYLRIKNSLVSEKIPDDSAEILKQRELFYAQFAGAGDLVYDVGANYGNRIIPLLKNGCKVVAIEPQKKCYTYLEKKFGNTIELVKSGLGEKEEVRDFYISNSSTISTFSNEWLDKVKEGRFRYYTWNKTEKVKLTTLDSLVQQFGLPKFIKIDVEGFEYEVLKGLHHLVEYISVEYNVPENLLKTKNCIQYLAELNPHACFNYSVGESMQLKYTEWMSIDDMQSLIQTDEFLATSFGDIYIKNKL